jgi:hypothetical protein
VNRLAAVVMGGVVAIAAVTPASAQTAADAAKAEAAQRQSRYQIGQMERVLEGAVEHGVTVTRDRLQTLAQMPADLLISDNAHARGFRLDGYGVFFDVTVPPFYLETTLWSYRTLDRNDLGLDSALKALQARVKGDPDLEQALKRVELQVNPAQLSRLAAPPVAGARNATGSAAATAVDTRSDTGAAAASAADAQAPADPILNDPNEAYRTEVIQALEDALLDHSASLGIGPDEWLTIAAKGNDDRPRLAPADSDSRTRIIRLRGSDLAAFLARQITRDEALKRIEVRVF